MAKRMPLKKCKHQAENYHPYLVVPLNAKVKNFNRIVRYFQYEAPEIDCVHSSGPLLDEQTVNDIFSEMMQRAKMQNQFIFIQKLQPNSLNRFHLEGNNICLKCPRMVCKIRKDETELSALLRHIRNTFAHGRTYVKGTKSNTYIVLEDLERIKGKEKITAKIVVTKSILEKWKAILENLVL